MRALVLWKARPYNGSAEVQAMSRIFLLEDDPSLATGLSFAFEKQGYELCVAKTICEA